VEDEMGGECGTYGGQVKRMQGLGTISIDCINWWRCPCEQMLQDRVYWTSSRRPVGQTDR